MFSAVTCGSAGNRFLNQFVYPVVVGVFSAGWPSLSCARQRLCSNSSRTIFLSAFFATSFAAISSRLALMTITNPYSQSVGLAGN